MGSLNKGLVFLGLVVLFVALGNVAEAIFPQPQSMTVGTQTVLVDPATFLVTTDVNSLVLDSAIQRYSQGLFFPFNSTNYAQKYHKKRQPVAAPPTANFTLSSVTITVKSGNESLYLFVDESYEIEIGTQTGQITAQTIFGAIRALETLSQLIEWDSTTATYQILLCPITITDAPRFPWRGFLLDTARHYIPIPTILSMIDALSYAKFNTLHWHAVDAESFPIVTNSYPLLSEKGAYAPSAVYEQSDIQMIVQYALERGIRVVPEFDVPGHSYSWGMGYPQLVATCPDYAANINNIPLDPTQNFTYTVLEAVFGEMIPLFTDNYWHVGGDELVTDCWLEDQQIVQWMKDNNVQNTIQLWQIFETQITNFLASNGRSIVAWEEVFENGINIPAGSIIEVWEDFETLQDVVNAGHYALMSSAFYLDRQVPVPNEYFYEWLDTWEAMYMADPYNNITSNQDLILGGEACMWSEQVDSLSIQERVWPRAAAVGERLWSAQDVTDITFATTRLNSFRCTSLARRGIHSSPVMPDYCELPM